jgi:ATP-binding cassette subfamily F protein uup
VSHDRAFLDNVVTQTIAYEAEGRWKEYAGGYTDWQRARSATPRDMPQDALQRRAEGSTASRRPAKLSFNEVRELEALPAKLEALEREQREINDKLADPAIYQDRAVDVRALNARHDELDAELTRLLGRWEELESKAGAARP